MPIDPEGGGSWISVNEHGLSLCLLNYYQGNIPSGPLISRGMLLRSLAHHTNVNALEDQLSKTPLIHYAPFTLVIFSQSTTPSSLPCITGYQWNGKSISRFQPSSPLTSSSIKLSEVAESRFEQYAQQVKLQSPHELKRFHTGHTQEKCYRSVCMHREDAKTVSLSHIKVGSATATFSYQNGSPCENQEKVTAQISVLGYSPSSSELSFSKMESTVCGP